MSDLVEKERTTPVTLSGYPSTITKLRKIQAWTGEGWSATFRRLVDDEYVKLLAVKEADQSDVS